MPSLELTKGTILAEDPPLKMRGIWGRRPTNVWLLRAESLSMEGLCEKVPENKTPNEPAPTARTKEATG